MFPIRNESDLRTAYDYLQIHREQGSPLDKQLDIKRAIRNYLHTERLMSKIVKDYGIDGYVLLMDLPDFLETQEDAEEYFKQRHVMRSIPSMYDCTGQAFTSGYKIFKRRDRFFAYHSVCFDV